MTKYIASGVTNITSIGHNTYVVGNGSTVVGQNAVTDGDSASVFGSDAYASREGVALGGGAIAGSDKDSDNVRNIAVGYGTGAYGGEALAVGFRALAQGAGSVSIGSESVVNGELFSSLRVWC